MTGARADLGALGCTRDGYQLFWASAVTGIAGGWLGFGATKLAGILARSTELAAFVVSLSSLLLTVIAYAALAPWPAGPLPAFLKRLMVLLALVMLGYQLLLLAPPDADRWVAARGFIVEYLLGWVALTPLILAGGSIPFLWRRGLRGPAIGWGAWMLVGLGWRFWPIVLPTTDGVPESMELYMYTAVANLLLLLTVPLWTALSLGRYVRGASRQTA